jgi:23S rRNA (cytosine1962-C5)-methyltransferase
MRRGFVISKMKLTRNLRRNVMRGHPWIYKEALQVLKSDPKSPLAEVLDQKGKFLAWALYDEAGPLSLRILSLEKKPPNENFFKDLIQKSHARRSFLEPERTNAYRLINGEGDRLPGLVCDLYDKTAVLQFDGEGPKKFWSRYPVADWVQELTGAEGVVDKTRGVYALIQGAAPNPETVILENGLRFVIDIVQGQKTGFFLDQRDNRQYVRARSKEKSVMNLFSYTGGFSIYAGAGGAKEVLSVDLAKPALEMAEKSWNLNEFKNGSHSTAASDVFDYLKSDARLWDVVIVDPPSMAHAEAQRAAAMTKYTAIFKEAASKVQRGGNLILSSCSSHVSFEDFFQIITESLSQAGRRGLIQRVSGQGADHPFPHVCPELRYLKFVHLALE